jgi:two-component system, NtrC family, response regulator AtoC
MVTAGRGGSEADATRKMAPDVQRIETGLLPSSDDLAIFDMVYRPLFVHTTAMKALLAKIQRVADTTATVLIRGESGVGKEVVAKAIHAASSRRRSTFVKVNCAALPSELLESELFGYEKGAFTGAYHRKAGKFELANGGTIFLDEIGDMPLPMQAKLLHVLQDQEFARVGGADTIRVDVRIIASTNRPLKAAVRSGQFREDLYYRLKVVVLNVPPLRERRGEIPILAAVFVRRFNVEFGRETQLSPESLDVLQRHIWPGNVRELENLMKSVVVLGDERLITEELTAATLGLPALDGGRLPQHEAPERLPAGISDRKTLKEIADRAATSALRETIMDALERVHWNRAEAARLLGVSYKTLLYKLDRCGLSKKRESA